MNLLRSRFIFVLAIISVFLTSCRPAAEDQPECIKEFCVLLELSEPITINRPFIATITVEPFQDFPDLEITAFADRPNVVFGRDHWNVGAAAGQPIVLTTTVTLPAEGYIGIYGGAHYFQYNAVDSIEIQMTQMGGTQNPGPYSNPYGLGASHTEGPTYQSPTTQPQPMPFDDYLINPGPEEALSVCGFAYESALDWEGAGLALVVYDPGGRPVQAHDLPSGQPISLEIQFQAPWEEAAESIVSVGLCLPSDQEFFETEDLVGGKRIWEIDTTPGSIYTFQVTGTFIQDGVYVLPVTAFVQDTGEVYGRHPRVRVGDGP